MHFRTWWECCHDPDQITHRPDSGRPPDHDPRVWGATQRVAAMLGYQSELGTPLGRVGQFNIYRPWDLFGWWYNFDAHAPQVFDRAGALAAASDFLGCGAAIF
jgi:type IV secretory pathway TraG/TraD family ATPase VirD4